MEPILTKFVREPNSFALDVYLDKGGYDALKKALTLTPDQIIEMVKASGLRGRGGAGFPTGMKWQFVDKKIEPRYIACNADESEPGTFKDHLLMERNPHLLIEGCAIGCYAIGARIAYIYIRGEFFHVQQVLERAIDEAYAKGYLGKNVLGSGFDCDVYVHRGAGASAQQAAVPGGRRAVQQADRRQQRRNALQRPAHRRQRARVVRGARAGEERRPEAVLRQRAREEAGRVRSVDEHHAPRADRRLCRRRARRAHAEGGDSGRIVGADPDARSARHAGVVRRHPEGGVAPRVRGDCRPRRHHVHGVARAEPAALLPPRIVRQVHALPRGDRLAAQDPAEDRRRPRRDARSRSAVEHLGQHRRQDAVRLRRRRGDAGRHHAEAFPPRVRSACRRRPLHARRRLARARAGGSRALMLTPVLIAQILLTLFVFFMLLNSAAIMVYVERKVAAFIQQRLGPYLVGPKGMLQPLADVVKLMFKEELRPKAADAFLFALAPIISATCAFAAFAVVPFGAETTFFGLLNEPIKLQVADVNVAVLVIFAIASMGV